MKWIMNDVEFEESNFEFLIARYDNNGAWYMPQLWETQKSMERDFKMFGEFLGASVCEVKTYLNDEDEVAENNIITFEGIEFEGEKYEKYILRREDLFEKNGEQKRK